MGHDWLIWGIAAIAILGVIFRPFGLPEAVWAVAGAALLTVTQLLPVSGAWAGIVRGTDVYLFLIGMMLLSEVARKEGLFDWFAGVAVRAAGGSAPRLFLLLYVVGTVVTVFLSNDACAVVLTPAVCVAARAAKVANPLPYVLICAFIANAASFVLPISNPANLVVFGSRMPPLGHWLALFALPSVAAIVLTYLVLRRTQAGVLAHTVVAPEVSTPALSRTGMLAGAGIVVTGVVLLVASALGLDLGLPTLIAGAVTTAAVLLARRGGLTAVLKDVSWGVLPLVAGLFVLVEAIGTTGVLDRLAGVLRDLATYSGDLAAVVSGGVVALGSNVVNNLPAGLIAGTTVHAADVSEKVTGAVMVGIDIGPNLSVTGSLATILWLTAIRREGLHVSALQFLKLGVLVMPPALIAAIACLLVLA